MAKKTTTKKAAKAKSKDTEYGRLTPQQEAFCQYVVDAYGTTEKGSLVQAYRKAFNISPERRNETLYSDASKLRKRPKIDLRIAELRNELSRLKSLSREEFISADIDIAKLDVMELYIHDEETGKWRRRKPYELPKRIRELVSLAKIGGGEIAIVDKEAARARIMRSCGFEAAQKVDVRNDTHYSAFTIID